MYLHNKTYGHQQFRCNLIIFHSNLIQIFPVLQLIGQHHPRYVLFLLGMELHIPTLCMTMMIIMMVVPTMIIYANGDSFNMNDPSIRLKFEKFLQMKHTQAIPQAKPQQTHPSKNTTELTHEDPPPIKHTTMKHTKDSQPPHKYNNTLQLSFLKHYENNTKDYVDEFLLYTVFKYHSILHERSILATMTIYTADGTTSPHAVKQRRPVKQTNASPHAAAPRMTYQIPPHSRLFLPLTPAPHTQLIPILVPSLVLRFRINQ